jgi:hypothetical protein
MRRTERLVFNAGGAKPRRETLHGRDYLVAPAVMMTEGVHNGSQGPIYYSDEFLAKSPSRWDHKPIVKYHPTEGNKHVSASDPKVLNASGLGFLLKTQHDSARWKTECWFDEQQTKAVDNSLLNDIKKGKVVEISTGLGLAVNEEEGEFNGEKYTMEAVDFDPDHLAVLPGGKGACSVEKGAGLCVNEEGRKAIGDWAAHCTRIAVRNDISFSEINYQLQDLLASKYGDKGRSWYGWIEATYDDYCVFYDKGKLYRQDYTVENDVVALGGGPEQVKRVSMYQTVNSGGVRRGGRVDDSDPESDMTKKQIVDGLIANEATPYDENDRAWLSAQSDERLRKIAATCNVLNSEEDEDPGDEDDGDEKPVVNAKGGNSPKAGKKAPAPKASGKKAAPAPKPAKGKKVNNEEAEEDEEADVIVANEDDEDETPRKPRRKEATFKELLANADPQTRAILKQGQKAYLDEKGRLVKAILNHPGNEFTVNELNEIDELDQLRKLAALASKAGGEVDNDLDTPTRLPGHFFGAQGGVVFNTAGNDDNFAGLADPVTVGPTTDEDE